MARPRRLPGFPYTGRHRYFLTFCTHDRHPSLRADATASAVLAAILRTARAEGFAITAYCLMPDHVHLLVKGRTREADLRRFVKRAKQSSGQAYSHANHRPLWMEGYHDRVIRSDEEALAIARYIIENPVRAGLVSDAAEYPYAGLALTVWAGH